MPIEETPGPQRKLRELHFYWILDTSGSMEVDGKIQSLNDAIRQAAPLIREAADDVNARGNLVVHAIEFNDGARWVNADLATGVPGSKFEWPFNLKAEGQTDMGTALEMVSEEMRKLPNNAFRPVLCLVTDGKPSDQFAQGLKKLMDNPWGAFAFRRAIAIGEDADLEYCNQFIGNREIKVLKAATVSGLAKAIQFLSITAADAAKAGTDVKAILLPAAPELQPAGHVVNNEIASFPVIQPVPDEPVGAVW